MFTGPIFEDDDPLHDGVRIPKEYWKVAAWVRLDGTMGAAAFRVSQEDLLTEMVLESKAEQVAQTFQERISEIERRTKLDFGRLRTFDTFRRRKTPLEARKPPVELESLERIVL